VRERAGDRDRQVPPHGEPRSELATDEQLALAVEPQLGILDQHHEVTDARGRAEADRSGYRDRRAPIDREDQRAKVRPLRVARLERNQRRSEPDRSHVEWCADPRARPGLRAPEVVNPLAIDDACAGETKSELRVGPGLLGIGRFLRGKAARRAGGDDDAEDGMKRGSGESGHASKLPGERRGGEGSSAARTSALFTPTRPRDPFFPAIASPALGRRSGRSIAGWR
jgi:hypothetical protein